MWPFKRAPKVEVRRSTCTKIRTTTSVVRAASRACGEPMRPAVMRQMWLDGVYSFGLSIPGRWLPVQFVRWYE